MDGKGGVRMSVKHSLFAAAALSGLLVTSAVIEVPGMATEQAQAASYTSYEKNVYNRVKNKTNYVYQGVALSGDRFSRYLEYQVIDGKTKINLSNYAKLNRSYVNVNNTKKAIAAIMEKPLYKGIVKTATVKKSGGQYYLKLTYAFKSTELKKFVKYVNTRVETSLKGYNSVLVNLNRYSYSDEAYEDYVTYKKFDRSVVEFLGTAAAKKTVLYYYFGDEEADTLAYNLYAKEVGARNGFTVNVDPKKPYVTATINKQTYVFDVKRYALEPSWSLYNVEPAFIPLQMYTLMQQGKTLPQNLTVYGSKQPQNYKDIFKTLAHQLYDVEGTVSSYSTYVITTKPVRTIFAELGYHTEAEIDAALEEAFPDGEELYYDLDGYYIGIYISNSDPDNV